MKKDKGDAVPQMAWEMRYNPCPYHNTDRVKGAEWNPKKSKDRVTTYNKVNEEDH